jgi:signal peptidase I
MIKKVLNTTYWILTAVLIVIATLAAMSAFGIPKQLRLFVVQSGSMEPAIRTGSVVLVKSYKDYKVGDIVTYKSAPDANILNPNLTITHRVVSVNEAKNETTYTTKGDANNASDMKQPSKELILGKVVFSIPYLGYPIGFVKTQTGFVLLIVIPGTIIVYSEIMNIREEIQKILKGRKRRKEDSNGQV